MSGFKPLKVYCSLCLQEYEAKNQNQIKTGLCIACRERLNWRRLDKTPKKKEKTGLTIGEVSARAKAAGMTYGKYVAKMDL